MVMFDPSDSHPFSNGSPGLCDSEEGLIRPASSFRRQSGLISCDNNSSLAQDPSSSVEDCSEEQSSIQEEKTNHAPTRLLASDLDSQHITSAVYQKGVLSIQQRKGLDTNFALMNRTSPSSVVDCSYDYKKTAATPSRSCDSSPTALISTGGTSWAEKCSECLESTPSDLRSPEPRSTYGQDGNAIAQKNFADESERSNVSELTTPTLFASQDCDEILALPRPTWNQAEGSPVRKIKDSINFAARRILAPKSPTRHFQHRQRSPRKSQPTESEGPRDSTTNDQPQDHHPVSGKAKPERTKSPQKVRVVRCYTQKGTNCPVPVEPGVVTPAVTQHHLERGISKSAVSESAVSESAVSDVSVLQNDALAQASDTKKKQGAKTWKASNMSPRRLFREPRDVGVSTATKRINPPDLGSFDDMVAPKEAESSDFVQEPGSNEPVTSPRQTSRKGLFGRFTVPLPSAPPSAAQARKDKATIQSAPPQPGLAESGEPDSMAVKESKISVRRPWLVSFHKRPSMEKSDSGVEFSMCSTASRSDINTMDAADELLQQALGPEQQATTALMDDLLISNPLPPIAPEMTEGASCDMPLLQVEASEFRNRQSSDLNCRSREQSVLQTEDLRQLQAEKGETKKSAVELEGF